MLRLTLDVNGDALGAIGIVNTGKRLSDEEDTKYRYEVHYIEEDDEKLRDCEMLGSLWHDREKGAPELSKRVLGKFGDDIEERLE